jgi:hypothetical protein
MPIFVKKLKLISIIALAMVFLPHLAAAQFIPTPFFQENSGFINIQTVRATYSATASATFLQRNTAGNTLVLAYYNPYISKDAGTFTVSDTAGNNWLGVAPASDSNGAGLQMWYAPNIVSSSGNVVTIDNSLIGDGGEFFVMEFSGLANSNLLDVFSTSIGSASGATISAGSMTPKTKDLVVGGFATGNGPVGTLIAGPAFTASASSPDVEFSTEFNTTAGTAANVPVNPSMTQPNVLNVTWWATALGLRAKNSVMPVAATKLAITSAALNTTTWVCSPVVIAAEDAGSTIRALQANIALTLSGANIYYFSDSSCSQNISKLYIWAGEKQKTIYIQQSAAGTNTLTATPLVGFNAVSQAETASLIAFTWVGATDASWTTASNWSNASVPSGTSTAYFDSNCTTHCSPNLPSSAVTVSSMFLGASYAGTITGGAAGAGLTVTNMLTIEGGTLTIPSTSTFTLGNLLLLTAGNLTISNNFTVTGSSFLADGSLTVGTKIATFTGANVSLASPSGFGVQLYKLVYNHVGGTMTLSSSLTTNSTMTVTAGTIRNDPTQNTSINISGFIVAASGTISLTNSALIWTSVNNNSTAAGGTVTLADNAEIVFGSSGSTYTNAGTTTCTSGSAKYVYLGGGLTNTGTYNTPLCLSSFEGLTNLSILGNNTFGTLDIYNMLATSCTVKFTAGTTQTVAGSLILNGTDATHRILLRSVTSGSQWNITTPADSSVGPYVDVKDSNNTGGFVLHGGTSSNDSGNNTNWTFP